MTFSFDRFKLFNSVEFPRTSEIYMVVRTTGKKVTYTDIIVF